VTDESFGRRLRRERERRHIALSSISANTKISVSLFAALERDDVSRWPSGIFRRAFIRAYAENVGLDPDETTREFVERFPDPAAPPPRPAAAAAAAPAFARARRPALRLTLADNNTPFARGRILVDMRRRLAAVGCDAAVVLAIAATVHFVLGGFWTALALTTLIYYAAAIVVLGNSPGVRLCAHTRRRTDRRPDATPEPDLLASLLGFVSRLNRTDWTRAVWRTFRSHV
jgi:transcriptional regulator with XRE-family HTH domain